MGICVVFFDECSVFVTHAVYHLRHLGMQIAHGLPGHQPVKMSYLWLRKEGRGEAHETWDSLNRRMRRRKNKKKPEVQ
jgi:hypothetical protein